MFRSTEQKHFSDLVAKHIADKDAPLLLEGGTGLGKTRAYLAALAGREEAVAIVLPTHQLIDQLLASTDLAATGLTVEAFRPARMFETRADYIAHRTAAMASRVMLCTSASVMIDQRLTGSYNGATRRDYLLFDEADQLPQDAALQQDRTISSEDLKAAGVPLTTVEETIINLIGKKGIEPEVRAWALIMRDVLEEPAWYHRVGKNDDDGIRLFHSLPGRLLKRIANQGNVAFISATLTVSKNFNDFRRGMGIGDISRLSGMVEPIKHGEIFVETSLDLSVADVIASAQRPCLVATTSHDGSQELAALVPEAVVRQRGETTTEAASRVSANGVLIAAGAWAGLDTPIRWASIVVPRIPFERPTVLDEKVESRYIDSKNVAVRRMRQVIGRGIRSPDARCTIYILDERYKKLGQFLPERFKESWVEGGRDIDQLITAERRRSHAIRGRALEHYGCKCYACDEVPPHPSIIDIHHLRPIAEGERQTTLQDVIPLCANCHRLAHTQEPPMPINNLRNVIFPQQAGGL
jgi:Rad3-related DNA helicase